MFRKKSCHSLFSLTGLTVSGLLVLMVLFGGIAEIRAESDNVEAMPVKQLRRKCWES